MSIWNAVWDSFKIIFGLSNIIMNQTDITTLNTTSRMNKFNRCLSGYTGDYCELECGLTYYENPNTKIVGGQISQPHSFPSAVYISFNYEGYFFLEDFKRYIYVNRSRKFMCGGTLIDKKTILTASHCIQTTVNLIYNRTEYTFPIAFNRLYPTMGSMYKVYLGVHNRSEDESIRMDVSDVIMHEKYDDINYLNDIALLKLVYPVNLNRKIQIACLPNTLSKNYPNTNQASWAVGWGTIDFGGPTSELLRMVKLNIYDSHVCKYVSPENTKDWNAQMCVGELRGGKDTCQGDSGGPLFIMENVGGRMKYIQAGITSYGDFCGLANSPGIYTRVSYYLDWIERHK